MRSKWPARGAVRGVPRGVVPRHLRQGTRAENLILLRDVSQKLFCPRTTSHTSTFVCASFQRSTVSLSRSYVTVAARIVWLLGYIYRRPTPRARRCGVPPVVTAVFTKCYHKCPGNV